MEQLKNDESDNLVISEQEYVLEKCSPNIKRKKKLPQQSDFLSGYEHAYPSS